MPPAGAQAARRSDARRASCRSRNARRRRRRGQRQSRPSSVPAAQSRRVPARGARSPWPRNGRDAAPASRQHQQRLRQCGRRAELFADPDGKLSARGGQDHRARGRRSDRPGRREQLQAAEDGLAAASGRGRARGHARRRVGPAHVPGRRRVHLPHGPDVQRVRRALRRHCRGRAARGLGRWRAGGAPRRSIPR